MYVKICETQKLDSMTRKLRDNPGWTAPHLAAGMGLINILKHEKMKNKLNEQESKFLRTPLLVAINHGNLGVVIALLELGADATIKDIKDNTVFHLAAHTSPAILQVIVTCSLKNDVMFCRKTCKSNFHREI